ncbi:16843_t:CDS:1, partial [Racocetra fulgida]
MESKKIDPSKACVVAFCNDTQRINKCIGKRDPEATTETFETIKPLNNRIFYEPLDKRFTYFRLFQEIENRGDKLELHDVILTFEVTSYHRLDSTELLELPVGVDMEGDDITTNITPIQEDLELKFYLIEICDKEIAVQPDPGIGDILLDRDFKDIQFREYINPIMEYTEKIGCEGCMFQNHVFEFCIDFGKLKVCKLEIDENDAKTFDKGNYAFVIIMDYMDWMYKFKKTTGTNHPENLGETFDLDNGNCGIPLFITNLTMEFTWKPHEDFTNNITAFIEMMDKCCKKDD